MVGINDRNKVKLPSNIISVHKTNCVEELAKLYTAADVFVNPTREEVLGLTNIEANACGTPVVMFNTGGSPECINNDVGKVIEVDDIEGLESYIRYIATNDYFSAKKCQEHAKRFEMQKKYKEYVFLYHKVLENENNEKDNIV